MTGLEMDIKITDHGIMKLLDRIQRCMHDLMLFTRIIGQIIRISIVRNFEKEGRPKKCF